MNREVTNATKPKSLASTQPISHSSRPQEQPDRTGASALSAPSSSSGSGMKLPHAGRRLAYTLVQTIHKGKVWTVASPSKMMSRVEESCVVLLRVEADPLVRKGADRLQRQV